jgi:hypothetical protein
MTETSIPTTTTTRGAEIDKLLERLNSSPTTVVSHSRLIFGLDATASRQPSWDRSCAIQGEMFEATAALSGLEIQLIYYRGFSECRASRWMTTAADLHRVMRSVNCVGGKTQIERVLRHAIRETGKAKRRHGVIRFKESKWANPYRIGRDGTREEVIAQYRAELLRDPELMAALPELRGEDLVCWCAPDQCHADVLLELANRD